ncbi:hypothetical protein W02_12140 [Nitrospira sp. KM1]|uniref:LysM peptidoglycan-binding domain-containing protein n=1 Tax=Nitrospira sp. KM1 TaxID=1936990 RepID=UPI0013A79860|nr:LysM peptidoglycan-binding domain-containing protein [Nitrospira sp. KM1]BCA54074.1 hypothetical protein W02_12140 [Nitrospira sp. KM1]
MNTHLMYVQPAGQGGRLAQVAFRAVLIASLYAALLFSVGCGELEPLAEPEIMDLQLTIDTLKTQVRDTQRNLNELRTELEARRQELADAQVARAQLEGRVREAERRVAEARQVINLQREELAAARTERERVSRNSALLQSQMRKMQRRPARTGGSQDGEQETSPAAADSAAKKAPKASAMSALPADWPYGSEIPVRMLVTPAAHVGVSTDSMAISDDRSEFPAMRSVSVKSGDTLWNIAHRHHVDLEQLKSLNGLNDDLIVVGQAIWLPSKFPSNETVVQSSGSSR